MTRCDPRPRPVVLAILDGFAQRGEDQDIGFGGAGVPVLSSLEKLHPRGILVTSGPDVGSGPEPMTTREEILLALGAGRVALTHPTRVTALEQRLADNEVVHRTIAKARDLGGRLHLIGVVSKSGVDSSLDHLFALVEVAKKAKVRVVVHALLDGRGGPPRTALSTIAEVESKLAGGVGRIGTVSGRAWAVDCDNRWDRVQKCYRAILAAEIYRADSARVGIEQNDEAGRSDEDVEPFVVFDYPGVSPVDVAIQFDHHPEGARALTLALASPRFDAFPRKGGRAPFAERYACVTSYDAPFDLPAAWSRTRLPMSLPELVSQAGYRQFRCTDAAVRLAPVAEDAIRSGQYDFVLVRFANPSQVENTRRSDAATDPEKEIDTVLGALVEAARSVNAAVLVAGWPVEVDPIGDPATMGSHAAEALRRTPVLYISDADRNAQIRARGCLGDIAPTLLELLGLPQPTKMTGSSLLYRQ
jgi:2,3-bisphosphoglycerate-independent phosphoglycerate mutase